MLLLRVERNSRTGSLVPLRAPEISTETIVTLVQSAVYEPAAWESALSGTGRVMLAPAPYNSLHRTYRSSDSKFVPSPDSHGGRCLLEPRSRFGDKPLEAQVVCPQNRDWGSKGDKRSLIEARENARYVCVSYVREKLTNQINTCRCARVVQKYTWGKLCCSDRLAIERMQRGRVVKTGPRCGILV